MYGTSSDNQTYIILAIILIIFFIIIGYYIKSCSDCRADDTCCQRSDLKTFCFTDCTLETESPNTGDNKVDCIGSWSEWSACTKDCAGGLKKRTYSITREASNGGEQCPFKDKLDQEVVCNTSPCPVDCIGQWGDWGECSVGCTNDGSGSGIQEKRYSVMVNSLYGGEECPEEDGTTISRVCNDGLLCHIDCEGSWERTNCQANDIDVICGDSERTFTFTTTTPPINDGETCLEKYGNEIPEYLRSQIGDILESGDEVSEQCESTSATALPVSYVGSVCSDCDETVNNILPNMACVPKKCGELGDICEEGEIIKGDDMDGYNRETCCIDKTCGAWFDNGGVCDQETQNRKEDDIEGYNAETCCEPKLCRDIGDICGESKIKKGGDEIGYDEATCCIDKTCGWWFDNEGGRCNLTTSTYNYPFAVGNTSEQCCKPKTCREIKQTLGKDTCPGNINTRIHSRSDPERSSQKLDKGLNLCFKNLDQTIPVDKMEGKQWEEICCGPSKIEIQEVAKWEAPASWGDHAWTEPAHTRYQFVAGRCDRDDRWTNANQINNNRINECHLDQAEDLPNVATECPDDDDVVHEEIYNSVYVDTFIKSESGWEYCTDPNHRDCINDTPDYSLLNY